MHKIFETYTPKGFSTMNTYLFVNTPEELIIFLKEAFLAEEINRTTHDGVIANCIMKVGDTCFMISQARGQFENMRAAHYLFVNDVDAVYQRAIEYGGRSEFPPQDMDYNDRQAGIVDPCGNYWWISKRLIEKDYHLES